MLTREAGPPALLRALPPLVALMLVATVVFGGAGMRPRDLCAVMRSSVAVRATLWCAWLLLTAPAARALVETPTTLFLRALPVPPWHVWIIHAAHLLALQLPWLLLFAIGEGPLAAVSRGLAAGALAAFVVARPVRVVEILGVSALSLAVIAGARPPALALVAIVAGGVAVEAAWTRAPERGERPGASLVLGSAPLALGLAHVAVLVRRDPVTLLRSAIAAVAGALVLVFALANNGVTDARVRDPIALAAGAIPLALATGGVAVRVLDTERELGWLLLTTGASARLRALTAAAVTSTWGLFAGLLYGGVSAALSTATPSSRLRLVALGAALGAVLGAFGAYVARRAERASGVDGTAVTVGMLAAAAASALATASLGPVGLAPLALTAVFLVRTLPSRLARQLERSDAITRIAWVLRS